jgi:hypothetical protein
MSPSKPKPVNIKPLSPEQVKQLEAAILADRRKGGR